MRYGSLKFGLPNNRLQTHIHTHTPTENFKEVLGTTSIHQKAPFNFDSNFVKLYFGQNLNIELNYYEFCQLLQVSQE